MTLVQECLNCNIFKWLDACNIFLRTRGLAMCQRLAAVLEISLVSRNSEWLVWNGTVKRAQKHLDSSRSAHPAAVKLAIVGNMLRTATEACSGPQVRKESFQLVSDIGISKGYTVPRRQRRFHTNSRERFRPDMLPFVVPFISDNVAAAFQKAIV